MQSDRKCASYWKSLHLSLIEANIPFEEIDVDTYCTQLDGDLDTNRHALFGPDNEYTCGELISTIWLGIRNSCVDLYPNCHDLLRSELEAPIVQLADSLGWNNINVTLSEFIRFETSGVLFMFVTKRLGISFMEVGGTIICAYDGTQIGDCPGWRVITLFCRIDESSLSFMPLEIVKVICLLRLLPPGLRFVATGPTHEQAFVNLVNELAITFAARTVAAIVLQRAWRKLKERRLLVMMGLILLRKTGTIQENLRLCYQHIRQTVSDDLLMVHEIRME